MNGADKPPKGAEAPIVVVEYDPAWPAAFESERELLWPLLSEWLVGPIEHIGSTPMPGMPAKPVIDLMAPVESLAASRPAIEAAAAASYVHYPYRPDVMHWFCKPSAVHRTHHLHLVPLDSELWWERIAFRDALRADPRLAEEYAALRRYLARRFRDDREAYTDGKSPFVKRVLEGLR